MMEAGRELDALVAEKVMGWVREPMPALEPMPEGIRPVFTVLVDMPTHRWRTPDGEHRYLTTQWPLSREQEIPHYSTDIAAAWVVAERLRLGVRPVTEGWEAYTTVDRHPWYQAATTGTAPHAICLAALRAVGVKL